MRYLIVGLGNPGAEYEGTRHNVGFAVLDALAQQQFAASSWKSGRLGQVLEATYRGRQLRLVKPTTYMNLSGKAVAYHWHELKLAQPGQLLVVTDELALPFGTLRLRARGSDGGHNGLKDIQSALGHTDYPRLRVGIGNGYPKGGQVDFVLARFAPTEAAQLPLVLEAAAGAVLSFVFHGLEQTMGAFNRSVLPPPPPE